MNRRKSIQNMIIATGGLITLPPWMLSCGISDSGTHASSFTLAEQELLSSIADTIIPSAASPVCGTVGALSAGVDKYLQKMLDDCYDKKVQENVKKQLKALTRSAQNLHNRSFPECSPRQRQELLLKWGGPADNEQKDFFDLMRSETIRGYTTSQKVMQEYLGYKVAPGHYHGCVDINT
jgi:hypothetical protein